MEDDLKIKMEDNLNFLLKNYNDTSIKVKDKIFLMMEDNLNFLEKGRQNFKKENDLNPPHPLLNSKPNPHTLGLSAAQVIGFYCYFGTNIKVTQAERREQIIMFCLQHQRP